MKIYSMMVENYTRSIEDCERKIREINNNKGMPDYMGRVSSEEEDKEWIEIYETQLDTSRALLEAAGRMVLFDPVNVGGVWVCPRCHSELRGGKCCVECGQHLGFDVRGVRAK